MGYLQLCRVEAILVISFVRIQAQNQMLVAILVKGHQMNHLLHQAGMLGTLNLQTQPHPMIPRSMMMIIEICIVSECENHPNHQRIITVSLDLSILLPHLWKRKLVLENSSMGRPKRPRSVFTMKKRNPKDLEVDSE
jgi:hypothetical protein